MDIKKILVPVDGSTPSEHALTEAISMAQVHHAEIIMVTVMDVEQAASEMMSFSPQTMNYASLQKEADTEAHIYDKSIPKEIPHTIKALVGVPGPAIVAMVKEDKPDMIVMGNSGKGALSSLILGSVSQYLIRHVKCPVLIVK